MLLLLLLLLALDRYRTLLTLGLTKAYTLASLDPNGVDPKTLDTPFLPFQNQITLSNFCAIFIKRPAILL